MNNTNLRWLVLICSKLVEFASLSFEDLKFDLGKLFIVPYSLMVTLLLLLVHESVSPKKTYSHSRKEQTSEWLPFDISFRLGYPCPMNFNPADYFVNTLAIVPEEEEESKTRVKVRTLLRKGCFRYFNFSDFPQCYLDAPNYRIVDLSFLKWRIQGRDPPPPLLPYFWTKLRPRRAEKKILDTAPSPSHLRVKGLDDPSPPPPSPQNKNKNKNNQ